MRNITFGLESRLNISLDDDHFSPIEFALLRRWLPRELFFLIIHTDSMVSGLFRSTSRFRWMERSHRSFAKRDFELL